MARSKIITYENPKSPTAEAYRTLRTNIQFSSIDKTIKSIVVTSFGPGEGKSTVTVNTAVTMAQAEKKVLLIDCDLRKPKVHTFFRIHNGEGLTNIIAGNLDYKEAIKTTEIVSGLDIITSGPIPPNPAELIGSQKMKNFLNQVKEDYDIVLVDASPVGMVTDAAILSSIVDGTIFVCAVGETDVEGAKSTKELLDKVNANILGVVLNKVPIKERGGYYRYQYYRYSYYNDDSGRKGKRVKKRRKNND
jgi:capsular exopolysaccharide synthesis family protein